FEPHLLREPQPRSLRGRSLDVSPAQVKSRDAAAKPLRQIERTVPRARRRVDDMTVTGQLHERAEPLRQPKTARITRVAEPPSAEVALVQARAALLGLGGALARLCPPADRVVVHAGAHAGAPSNANVTGTGSYRRPSARARRRAGSI